MFYLCQEIECRHRRGCINGAVQLDNPVYVIQCHLAIKPSLLVFPVQRYIMISISTIVQCGNQTCHGYGRILPFPVISIYIHIKGYAPQFIVPQSLTQFKITRMHGSRVGKPTFFPVRTKFYIRIHLTQIGLCPPIHYQIGKIPGNLPTERNRSQTFQHRRDTLPLTPQVAHEKFHPSPVGIQIREIAIHINIRRMGQVLQRNVPTQPEMPIRTVQQDMRALQLV